MGFVDQKPEERLIRRRKMEKIVIIGANDFQNPLILKAKEMGFETHVFAWRDGAIGEKTADYFYPISIVEKEKILEICQKIHPIAIVSIASDLAAITVNFLSRNLHLPSNSERNVLISTNKYEMRKAFQRAGVSTPQFLGADNNSDMNEIVKMKLPVIVKPTDRSGSRGITKLESWEGLRSAISEAVENSFEKKAIVEEYLKGDEYSCECVSFNGEHHFLAITQKFTTGAPHFIETGHIEPSGLENEQIERVKKIVFAGLNALEITNGASHSEVKIDAEGNVHIIEIGGRMGGDCIGSDLVPLSTGYDFLKMVIYCAIGKSPELKRSKDTSVAVIRFIFTEDDYKNFCEIKKNYPEKIYRASDIKLEPEHKVIDSSSREGFYILKCDSREEAKRLAQL